MDTKKNQPSLRVFYLKIILLTGLVLFLFPYGCWLGYYLVGGLFYNGWEGGFWQRVEQLDADNYSKEGLVDITPPPLDPNHVSIGSQGPYFLFLKINRGESPEAQDPRYSTDRDQVEFKIRKGYGVLKPFLEKRGFWDSYAFFHDYTFTSDNHGQVLLAFYPSAFPRTYFGSSLIKTQGREIVITAKVLNNPRIPNEVTYEWTPMELHQEDFDRAVNTFVDWHNGIRLIDRTEVGTSVTGGPGEDMSHFNQVLGITPTLPSSGYRITVQGGDMQSDGRDIPNGEYTYDYFFEQTGREPWGYMGGDPVFISRTFPGAVAFWTYDPGTGLMKEKLRYPAPSGLGAQEDQCQYQLINGHYFNADDLCLEYYGQVVTYRTETRNEVTLAP